MAERSPTGVLDTCAYIDLGTLDLGVLPYIPELTAGAMAELHQGIAMAKDGNTRAVRAEKLAAAIAEFDPLPFDDEAAARYGTFVANVSASGRNPRPRKMGLIIAVTASVHGLPLYTRNPDDFVGLDETVTIVAV